MMEAEGVNDRDILTRARSLWLRRQETRGQCWRRVRTGWHIIAVLVMVGVFCGAWALSRPPAHMRKPHAWAEWMLWREKSETGGWTVTQAKRLRAHARRDATHWNLPMDALIEELIRQLERDRSYWSQSRSQQDAILHEIRAGQWQWPEESPEAIPPAMPVFDRAGFTLGIGLGFLVLSLAWALGVVIITATHSVARWMDRYPG